MRQCQHQLDHISFLKEALIAELADVETVVESARQWGGGSPMVAAWTTRSKGAVGSV